MGVPKFFRYISERYPCLSEFVKEYQIPVFDNLYLDMNGIIHMCSHPDDNNPHFRITEEKIFSDIFHYIEVLFRMIKPQKVFFMAVDGVAPRAKMNQQRGRRFRSAKEAERLRSEAIRKGETLPEGARFDSNCITPGTTFMARLQEQLKYFVVNKISTDDSWQKCKVILSGHETPGEGEHKIMDYIRYMRSQPGYDPNTRHCLYGLDADLIMLGLCTHEPHFSLLREEVKFGKKVKRSNVPEQISFYLLHLSLMRDYLELEFSSLKTSLEAAGRFDFDLEKIIDDWILMGFLVGNDFIPNLPNLHISNGALPVLYEAYISILPTLDGYINESGTLHLERFEVFMRKLAEIDTKNFEDTQEELMWLREKRAKRDELLGNVNVDPEYKDPGLAALIASTDELDISSDESDTEKPELSSGEKAFKAFKDDYYRTKLQFPKVTADVLQNQAEGYVRAIQWNLNYYYNGVCSWSWYYPHHYSPYISDIKGFSSLKLEFELGSPFKPYEQLLAVLPTASKELLPECYHKLMTDDESIIKTYYPEEFETDLNGKRQEWEAVVLVPFIDENLLLKAMEPCNKNLTLDEIARNIHGPMLIYEFSKNNLGLYKATDYFPDIKNNYAQCTPFKIEDLRVSHDLLVTGAYPGAAFDVYYPGFPTLKHIRFTHSFQEAKVKVFETPSRNENLLLQVLPSDQYVDDSIPEELLGKIVWVGWPHLVEAKIVAICNRKVKYVYKPEEDKKYIIEERAEKFFDLESEGCVKRYHERMGISLGKTKVLLHVKVMIGRKYGYTSNGRVTLEKEFSNIISFYPIQSIVSELKAHEEFVRMYGHVTEVFPVGSTCYSLTNPHYGSRGTVLDSTESLKNGHLQVSFEICEEPNFSSVYQLKDTLKKSHLSLTNAASYSSISNHIFSKITGSIFASMTSSDSLNIGLNLKFNKKNQETPGYTCKRDGVWYYTQNAVHLVQDYLEKFPEVFQLLTCNNGQDLSVEQLYPEDGEEKLKILQSWLKTLPTYKIERQTCGTLSIDKELIDEIERVVQTHANSKFKTIVLKLRPQLLFKPGLNINNAMPDISTKTKLYDRIVNVRHGYTVPVGLKGTVISINKSQPGNEEETYDVVFDEDFPGGLALNCSELKGYNVSKRCFLNLSHGKRMMEERTGVPGALRELAAKDQRGFNQFHQNPKQNSNFNVRPVNSAFASFNKYQSPSVGNEDRMYMTPPVQDFFKPQYQIEQRTPKNTFQDMINFGGQPEKQKKFEKRPHQASSNQTKKEFVTQQATDKRRENVNMPRASVDTVFLKSILKIPNNSGNSSNAGNKTRIFENSNLAGSSEKARLPSMKLFSYYQSNSLGCPRYNYLEKPNGCFAQIILPHGQVISGEIARTKEAACENVASEVLKLIQDKTINLSAPGILNFPVPPKKWVQEPHQFPYQNSKEQKPDAGKYVISGNFVPLQALKKRPQKASGSKIRNEMNTSHVDDKIDPGKDSIKQNVSSQAGRGRRYNGPPRKTRIAANFEMTGGSK